MNARKFHFDEGLLLTITAVLLNAADYEDAVSTNQSPDQPPAFMHMSLCKVLRTIISKRKEAYPTTMAQDVALLANPETVGRRRMAIGVRLGEKEILATATEEIDKRIALLLQAEDQADSSNSSKKRKF